MDKIFLSILNTSILGAFVITAVILARLHLKKAPKIIFYCLWAVVGLATLFSVGFGLNRLGVLKEPPRISITCGDAEIFWVVGINKWNGAVADRLDGFQVQRERIINRDMPYIKNGEKISVSFGNSKPDSITLSEVILDESGTAKWKTDEHVLSYELSFKPFSSTADFIIEPNYATLFSSDSHDYEGGHTIKGYKLVCEWGNNQCEYAFVILGDAAVTREQIVDTEAQTLVSTPDKNQQLELYAAQLTHDGSVQTIVLDTSRAETDWLYTLQVVDGNNETLWQAEASLSHAGWNSVFLTQVEGKDYLLQYNPTTYQGSSTFSFRIFSLDKNGNEILLDADAVDFSINPPGGSDYFHKSDIHPIKAFYEHINQYLSTSQLLLNTDEYINSRLSESNKDWLYGTKDSPVTMADYFYKSSNLTIDEQISTFVRDYTEQNGELED